MLKAVVKNLKSVDESGRVGESAGPRFEFGPFMLDARRGRLWRGGEPVGLTRKAVETLTVLVSRAGQVVEKEDLMQQVWPATFVTEDTLTQNISTLRKVLGETPEIPEFITTIPRCGYRFVAPVTRLDEPSDPGTGEILTRSTADRPADGAPTGPSVRERIWMGATALSLVVSVLLAVLLIGRVSTSPADGFRFSLVPPRGVTLASPGVVSPDGRQVVFVARNGSSQALLMVRRADSLDPVPLEGTEGADDPFWSPDGRAIAYFANSRLMRVSASGGPPVMLAETGANPLGGTWNQRGTIVYSPGRFSALHMVPASGGKAERITQLQESERESGHWWPQFLPDGERFLFTVASANENRAGLYLGGLGGGATRLLDVSAAGALYAWPGYLLFVRDNTLMAQAFDARALRTTGAAVPIASDVAPPDFATGRTISASNTGVLTYASEGFGSQLTWLDRSGQPITSFETSTQLRSPALSSDGRFVAGHRMEVGRNYLWLLERDRHVVSRLTAGAATGQTAVWSPDGQSLAFASDRQGSLDLYLRPVASAGDDELLVADPRPERPFDWSPDGRFIVFGRVEPGGKQDLWLLPVEGKREPVVYLQTPFHETQAQISPDGRWLTYASDESGKLEVYLQAFPQPGQKWRVSRRGGAQPRWRRDGRELFFLAPDGHLMVTPISLRSDKGPEIGEPTPLFAASVPGRLDTYRNYYVVTPDGERFLMEFVGDRSGAVVLLQNWVSALRP